MTDELSVNAPDTVVLVSAGIDIGSATSQLLVSRLVLKRLGRAHSSRYIVASRETVFESPVIFTPYLDPATIDADGLVGVIGDWLQLAAGVGEIETGVVLLTGEAVRRSNAEAIANRVSQLAGDFVCAAAGDIYEAHMAAMGSGAIEQSRTLGRILNIDIGGGTTKLSIIDQGEILESSVVRVGSRGIAFDQSGLVTRLEISGRLACEALGVSIQVGSPISEPNLANVAEWMVARIDEHIFGLPAEDPAARLRITPSLSDTTGINGVIFSSGVAEYIHGRTTVEYGDLGRLLAACVDTHVASGRWPWPRIPVTNPMRATALGISQYTVEVSGDTVFVGNDIPLPQRNRQVIAVDLTGLDGTQFVDAMADAVARAGLESVHGQIAWRLSHRIGRRFLEVAEFSRALGESLVHHDDGASVVLLAEDLAMTVGRLVSDELHIKQDIIVLDGLSADASFLDVGQYQEESATVPIVLKSLVFDELREEPS